jgi:hypothetical protein
VRGRPGAARTEGEQRNLFLKIFQYMYVCMYNNNETPYISVKRELH